MIAARVRWRSEAGSGPITSVFGVAMFLGFLFLASQVLVHLYATSTVTAVAFDEARRASVDGGDCVAVAERARERLGEWGADPRVEVDCEPGEVGVSPTTVRIHGPSPARALGMFGRSAATEIDRAASFLTEPAGAP